MPLSGPSWIEQFPTSKSVDDLVEPFRTNVKNFLQALSDAGADVSIAATFRPPERAFLMHYCYQIAKGLVDPSAAPSNPAPPASQDINIQWLHTDDAGDPDTAASIQAAAQMVASYAIRFAPVLASRHTEGLAIDMDITWEGVLSIADATGMMKIISSVPRDGGNTDLHAVGATYGVIKLITDPPHWSSDGH
jgi:hypothetical protein